MTTSWIPPLVKKAANEEFILLIGLAVVGASLLGVTQINWSYVHHSSRRAANKKEEKKMAPDPTALPFEE